MKFFILAWTKKLRNWHHWKERLEIRKPRKCAWRRRIRFLFKYMFLSETIVRQYLFLL